MTDNNNIQKSEDELIRQMIQSAKKQAPENLKYRIMQQIETEKAVSPQKTAKRRRSENILRDFRPIFGTAYILLFGFSLFTVIFGGEEAVLTSQFLFSATLIVIVSLSFWASTRLEARLRKKLHKSHHLKS